MLAYTFYETDNRVRRYAEALVKRGDIVEAIVLGREGQAAFETIKGVDVYRIQRRVRDERGPFSYLMKLLMFFFRSAWTVSLHHIRDRYDLIHVHSVPDFEVFGTIVPKVMGARVILDIHDIIPEFYASKFKVGRHSLVFRLLVAIEKLSALYSDHVIISNHIWYEKLIDRSVTAKNCTAIINYPDTSVFRRQTIAIEANGEFVIAYPGTLNWHQGVDLAIRAVALLRDKVPHLQFLIVGDGPDREKLEALIAEQGLEGHVKLSGVVPLEEVAKMMSAVDLGVVPKRNDAFGGDAFSTKIMEFMAMGVPVVASKTRVDQYYFSDDLVQFFDPENIEDLAAKILELVRDFGKREGLRARALNFIQKNNWDVRKNEYLDLVDDLVKGRPRAPGENWYSTSLKWVDRCLFGENVSRVEQGQHASPHGEKSSRSKDTPINH